MLGRRASVLIILALITFQSCEEEETLAVSNVPFIEGASILFKKGSANSVGDTLQINLTITDGNFDIGLGLAELDSPYHQFVFHLENGSNIIPVIPKLVQQNNTWLFDFPQRTSYQRVTAKTKSNGGFPNLPEVSCHDYESLPLSVPIDDVGLFDPATLQFHGSYYSTYDSYHITRNQNFTPLDVTILVSEPAQNSFAESALGEAYCINARFDGRLPRFSEPLSFQSGPFKGVRLSDHSMVLTYTIVSQGWFFLFKSKDLKIKATITDRALNQSNQVESNIARIPG